MVDLALLHTLLSGLEDAVRKEFVVRDNLIGNGVTVVAIDADLGAVFLAPVQRLHFAHFTTPVGITVAGRRGISLLATAMVVAVARAAGAIGSHSAVGATVVLVALANTIANTFTVSEAVELADSSGTIKALEARVADTEVFRVFDIVNSGLEARAVTRAAIGAFGNFALVLLTEAELALATSVGALTIAMAVAISSAQKLVAFLADNAGMAETLAVDADTLVTSLHAQLFSATDATEARAAMADLVHAFTTLVGSVAAKSTSAETCTVVTEVSRARRVALQPRAVLAHEASFAHAATIKALAVSTAVVRADLSDRAV